MWYRTHSFLFAISLVVGALLFGACKDESRLRDEPLREYTSRQLMLENQDFLIPDIEGRLTKPVPEYFVDPDKPLDRGRFGDYLHDQDKILDAAVLDSAAKRIEELLFE